MGTHLLRMLLMCICTLGEAWKDPSQIPASEIVDVWREHASSGRFANSYIWGAEALLVCWDAIQVLARSKGRCESASAVRPAAFHASSQVGLEWS